MDSQQIDNNSASQKPAHPFVGISPWPRYFVYFVSTLFVGTALLVFTERYLDFLEAPLYKWFVMFGYALIVGNLSFLISRRFGRKLFDGDQAVLVVPILLALPVGIWLFFKENISIVNTLLFLVAYLAASYLGNSIGRQKAATFRANFLEEWQNTEETE